MSLPLDILSILFLKESFEKPLGLSHCGTESLLKSQEKKNAWYGREFLQTAGSEAGLKAAFACSATLIGIFSHAWWLCTPPAAHQAFLWQKSSCSYFCILRESTSAQNSWCCFTFVPFQDYYEP